MYDPQKHNKQSIRMQTWDYSTPMRYFLTINIQYGKCLLGTVENGKMHLNDAGNMINRWYLEMENKYPNIKCDTYQIMPNHFHCIIEILYRDDHKGDDHKGDDHKGDDHKGASLCGCPDVVVRKYGMHNKKTNASIFDMMDWFKTMTTNEYIRGVKSGIWPRFEKRFWQKRYWDVIIFNEKAYLNIKNYIKDNPINWKKE